MSELAKNNNWTSVIKPKGKFSYIDIREIIKYRDLIFLFVKRDFVAYYKQTILGPFWYLLQPLFTTIVFTIIFGNIAKIPTDGVPPMIFYMSGTIIWNYFSQCVASTSSTFISNAGVFGKVYFPRLVTPISVVVSKLITFSIQFCLFIGFFFYFLIIGTDIKPGLLIIFTPFLVMQVAFLGIGIGILISALTTKYRDLQFLVGFGLQLWMYATPIVYPMSQIPEKWKIIFIFNPMAAIIESFRFAFLGVGEFRFFNYVISIFVTLIIILFGLFLFTKVERTFMDKV